MKYFLLVIFLQVPVYAVELTEQQAKADIKAVVAKPVKTKDDITKLKGAMKLLSSSWAKPQE